MILTPWLGNNEIPEFFSTHGMAKICYRFCDFYHLFIKREQKSPRLWQEVEFALANNSFGPVYKASYVVILCNLQELLVEMFGFYDHIDYLQIGRAHV